MNAQRWDELPSSTPLGSLVAPFVGMNEDEIALDHHLVGNGTIQLFNPGFDEHLIGVGEIPWFGFGKCALLAWHLHIQSGWPLVTLEPGVQAPMVHTGVRAPDGSILDWRGAQTEVDAVEEYQGWLYPRSVTEPNRPNWRWREQGPDEWIARWLHSSALSWSIPANEPIEMGGWDIQIEVGGRQHRLSPYDQFEITLADHLARLILSEDGMAV